jgi:hypothetical protein
MVFHLEGGEGGLVVDEGDFLPVEDYKGTMTSIFGNLSGLMNPSLGIPSM